MAFATPTALRVTWPRHHTAIQSTRNVHKRVCNKTRDSRAASQPSTTNVRRATTSMQTVPEDGMKEQADTEWRPHVVSRDDVTDDVPDELPVELAEGFMRDDLTRPRFDLDADEHMLMWKVRRMLHKDDYKRIFDNPRIGEL